jgi:hypothetical protein
MCMKFKPNQGKKISINIYIARVTFKLCYVRHNFGGSESAVVVFGAETDLETNSSLNSCLIPGVPGTRFHMPIIKVFTASHVT